jgi:hypothetical protein
MTEQELQKLRSAGFSEDDIREYTANQTTRSTQPGSQSQADQRDARGPELDPTAPSETLIRAQAAGLETEGRPSSFFSDVATMAPVLAGEYAVPLMGVGAGAGALYGANQLRRGMQARAGAQTAQAAAQQAQAQAMMEQARAAQMQTQGLQQRFEARQAANAARAVPPAPMGYGQPGMPPASYNVPTGGVPGMPPATAPAAPQDPFSRVMQNADRVLRSGAPQMAPQPPMAPQAPQAQAPGVMSSMLSAAAPYARFAGGAGLMAAPRNLNTGEQQQLNQLYPERAPQAQEARSAIQAAGRQPRSQADLDQMIRAAAAKRALMMGQPGQ